MATSNDKAWGTWLGVALITFTIVALVVSLSGQRERVQVLEQELDRRTTELERQAISQPESGALETCQGELRSVRRELNDCHERFVGTVRGMFEAASKIERNCQCSTTTKR